MLNTAEPLVSINQGGIEQNPFVDSDTNQMGLNRIIPKELELYVPENFDIDELLSKHPPNFAYVKKEYFIYLVSLLISIPATRKRDVKEERYYTPLCSELLQRKCREYKHCLWYLVETGVIKTDNHYICGSKSKGYVLTPRYMKGIKPEKIYSKTLIKAILRYDNIDDENESIVNSELEQVPYLTKWFNHKLTIDYLPAKGYIYKLYLKELKEIAEDPKIKDRATAQNISHNKYVRIIARRRYLSRLLVIEKIRNKDFRVSIDRKAGRFHSPLTQLKSELRQFLKYDGKSLIAVDIVNSQPYLSLALIDENKFLENNIMNIVGSYNKHYTTTTTSKHPIMLVKNIEENKTSDSSEVYRTHVSSGNFYEEFGQELVDNKIIVSYKGKELRKKTKEITFSAMFCPNNKAPFIDGVGVFKDSFPQVYKVFKLIKNSNGEHNTLALTLQNFEAKLVLHKACKLISEINSDIPLFTLHDSIVTTPEYVTNVKEVLTQVLTKAIGVAPTLKEEEW